MPPFRSTPKWPFESTQPSAFSVARPKKSAWPLKPKNHSPSWIDLVDVRVRARCPVRDLLVAADENVDGRVEPDHVEQADGAVDVQLERVGVDGDPVGDVILVRRVQPDLAVALDRDDVEDVEVDPDVELEHEADVVVRGVVVDAGEAARVQRRAGRA